jgi:hypothetical protein
MQVRDSALFGRPALLVRRLYDHWTAGMRERADTLLTYRCLRAQRRAMTRQNGILVGTKSGTSEQPAADVRGSVDDARAGPQALEVLAAQPIDPTAWDKCTLEHCFKSWALAGSIKWVLILAAAAGALFGQRDVMVAGLMFAGLFQVLQTSSSADLVRGVKRVQRESRQLYAIAQTRCAGTVRSSASAGSTLARGLRRRLAGAMRTRSDQPTKTLP